MSIIRMRHITIGKSSGAAIYDLGRYDGGNMYSQPKAVVDTNTPAETQPSIISSHSEFANWGDDNQLPNQMVEDMEATGILSGTVDHKVRFGMGNVGPLPYKLMGRDNTGSEQLESVIDPEIEDWLDENNFFNSTFGWFKDMIGLGQDIARLKYNRKGDKVGLMWRHDVAEMRLSVKNKQGHIKEAYLSALWANGVGVDMRKNKDVIALKLIPSIGSFEFIKEQGSLLPSREFAMVNRLPGWLRHYYSMPPWWSARQWVEIAKGIPEMKVAMFENNIRLKYEVIIMQEYWAYNFPNWDDWDDPKKEQARNEVYDDIDEFLAGSKNAYKSIFIDGGFDPVHKQKFQHIEIKAIKDETKPGELLPDSAAANYEILFSMGMSPALLGLNTVGGSYGGGAGSGSDIREAANVQVMIQAFERQSVTKKMQLVSRINGWSARHKNLVWRFPGLLLTTLDKGKSTETTMAGNPAPPVNK